MQENDVDAYYLDADMGSDELNLDFLEEDDKTKADTQEKP